MKFSDWLVPLAMAMAANASPTEESIPQVFENTNVQQTFDLSATYVKRSIILDVKNIDKSPQSEYYFPVDPEFISNIAVMEARDKETHTALPVELDDNQEYYKFTFPEPLEPGAEKNLLVAQAITGAIRPLPEQGQQDDQQFFVFGANKYVLSPYVSKKQATRVKALASLEQLEGEGEVNGVLVNYGPFEKVKQMTVDHIKLRYENPRPMVKATNLDREVWVSHWGASVSFEETYWLHNFGTRLKDFSRLHYQRPQTKYNLNVAALKELTLKLGPKARDVYYTDLVGNVSTSHFRTNDDESVYELKPRYPLFGGWNYNFTIGWSADIDAYVKDVGQDTYLLRVPFIEGPSDMAYDNVNVKIVLPEGASEVNVLSLLGNEVEQDTTFSFLDSVGRPTIKLNYDNVIDGHRRGEVYVKYKYTAAAHYTKPLSISMKFAVFFAVTLALSRVNISLSRSSGKVIETPQKK